MDKAYNSDCIRQHFQQSELKPIIPPKLRSKQPDVYAEQYQLRLTEGHFSLKGKHLRGLAIRYEELSQTFRALLPLIASWAMIIYVVDTAK